MARTWFAIRAAAFGLLACVSVVTAAGGVGDQRQDSIESYVFPDRERDAASWGDPLEDYVGLRADDEHPILSGAEALPNGEGETIDPPHLFLGN